MDQEDFSIPLNDNLPNYIRTYFSREYGFQEEVVALFIEIVSCFLLTTSAFDSFSLHFFMHFEAYSMTFPNMRTKRPFAKAMLEPVVIARLGNPSAAKEL